MFVLPACKSIDVQKINFSYLEKIINESNHVTHIDHHVTIRDDVIQLELLYKKKFVSVYDVNESVKALQAL